MPSPAADLNLLFGIMAVQNDFVSRDALIEAMHAWVLDKARSLGDILVERGALSPERHALLTALVAEHIKAHHNDPQHSLASIPSASSLRQQLSQFADADVQASVAVVGKSVGAGSPDPAPDPEATTPEARPAAGLRYRILRPHAKGGLGEVFVAEDVELHREVALKEIQPVHAHDATSRGRFLLEAEVTGRLEHPGIVPVYGLGQYADGRPFYAMRFIHGDNLKEAIRRFHEAESPTRDPGERRRALRQLLGRFIDVCNAVAYAHSRGVLHRDLKPGNIMLGKYGETLVVDWGLAKAVGMRQPTDGNEGETTFQPSSGSGVAMTQMGSAMGTPAYMSPEQANGQLDKLGPASDIYSLGATLYALITGQAPFREGEAGDMLQKVRTGDFVQPRRISADVPAPLEAICLKAMALDPAQRYRMCAQLAEDIEHWLADEPVSAWPEPWSVWAQRWTRRHWALVTSVLAALVMALISLTIGLILLAEAKNEQAKARSLAEQKEQEAKDERDEAKRRREEARSNLYIAQMNLVQREYQANNVPYVLDLLERQVAKEPGLADLRGFEWYYWNQLTHSEFHTISVLHTINTGAGGVTGLCFSPDGKWIASSHLSGLVRISDSASGKIRLNLKGHRGPVESIAVSPNGNLVASASLDGTVKTWDSATGRESLTLRGHGEGAYGVAFHPDGTRLASASRDGKVRVWDSASGKALHTIDAHAFGALCVAFSPDGRRLASAGNDGAIRIWDSVTGGGVLTLTGHTQFVNCVVFSPDGRQLLSGSADNTLKMWDSETGRELLTLRGHSEPIFGVAFSPDGRRCASASVDFTVRIWHSGNGKQLLSRKTHSAWVRGIAYSPHGNRLVSGSTDGQIKLWDSELGQERLSFRGHIRPVNSIAFSPDSERAASASNDGTLKVWKSTTGQELLSLEGHTAPVNSVALSPNGEKLASAGADQAVRLWEIATKRQLFSLKGHTSEVNSIAFSPDGRWLASAAGDKTIRIWDSHRGLEHLTLNGHTGGVRGVCFSPDGTRLASASLDRTVKVWDCGSGRELLTLRGHTGEVYCLAFSPDGEHLASGSNDHTVRVWDAASGRELLTIKGYTSPVLSVCFSPDGKRLAAGGMDATIKVRDVSGGQELLSLQVRERNEIVKCVAFSPDGRRLVAALTDNTLRLWDAGPVSQADLEERQIVGRVHDLFEEFLLRSEVVQRLQKDPTLGPTMLAFALRLTDQLREEPVKLNEAAWLVVRERGRDKEAYRLALHQAQAAVQAAPQEGFCLNTLCVAHYRLGENAKAVENLQRAEKLNTTKAGPHPADLAFLAMARHQLGQKAEADQTLTRLLEVMKQPLWANDPEAQNFLREAEETLKKKPASETTKDPK